VLPCLLFSFHLPNIICSFCIISCLATTFLDLLLFSRCSYYLITCFFETRLLDISGAGPYPHYTGSQLTSFPTHDDQEANDVKECLQKLQLTYLTCSPIFIKGSLYKMYIKSRPQDQCNIQDY
jgi:hypothetical protein